MILKNLNVRNQAKIHGLKLWEIAEEYGVTDSTFSRKLRHELSEEESEKIIMIIENLSKRRSKI